MASPLVIQKPIYSHKILVYLSAFEEAINSVLIQEVDKEQKLVYFMRRTLQEAGKRYQTIKKIALTLVHTTRIKAYFQNHPVIVKTDYPIKKVLAKSRPNDRVVGQPI